jgi:hypothetical protein
LVEGRAFYGSWVSPVFKADSNLTGTILLDVLKRMADTTDGKLPPVLFLHMDNCGRENKNHTIMALLGSLVKKKVFRVIYLHFLPVGHTHAKVDQRFSVISTRFHNLDAFTMPQLMEVVGGAAT